MPLTQFLHFLREKQIPLLSSTLTPRYAAKLHVRILEVLSRTWDLGFTAFGGPPVHFQIFHRRFVEKPPHLSTSTADTVTGNHPDPGFQPWLDEQTYQELFALAQALPGPGSTKMLFSIILLHSGFLCALLAFLIWSLPGALGMYGLSLGVRSISDTLPNVVYALLSGLNAATVGIVAVAAVQLAEKCIKDRLTRLLVLFGAAAGLCYSALWYFPMLVGIGGLAAVLWDLLLGREVRRLRTRFLRRTRRARAAHEVDIAEQDASQSVELQSVNPDKREDETSVSRRVNATASTLDDPSAATTQDHARNATTSTVPTSATNALTSVSQTDMGVSMPISITVLLFFSVCFIAILVTRSQLSPSSPLSLDLFANMLLAGTIIFGGGPVVIPLLREYVVTPGWVSPRDFLIGLAIIQAFPGPNFNFGVYLGALTLAAQHSSRPSTASSTVGINAGTALLGALLGFIGIFLPGLSFAVGVQGLWRRVRSKRVIISALRGINATAVGLVFTAVYRLWEVGYLTADLSGTGSVAAGKGNIEAGRGRSLADEPWWVVVASVTYCGNKFFGIPAAASIVLGGLLGLGWYGVTQK